MALPSAQLGSLPSMQVPYQIPRYEKPAGLLERALAGFLANVATQAGGQLASNAFSRDFGSELGGEDASFMRKLFSGPNVDRQEYNAQMDQQRKLEELGVRGQIDIAKAELQDFLDRGRDSTNANMNLAASDLANDRAVNAQLRHELNSVQQQNRQAENQTALEQLKAQIGRDSPQGQLYRAQAEGLELQNDTLRGMRGQGQAPGGLSPEDAAAADAARAAKPSTQEIQDFLNNQNVDMDVGAAQATLDAQVAERLAQQEAAAKQQQVLDALSQIDPMLAAKLRFGINTGLPSNYDQMSDQQLYNFIGGVGSM